MREQMNVRDGTSGRKSSPESKMKLADEIDQVTDDITAPFESKFEPSEMRQLALVAHNHMKPAMKEFIETYSEVLMKFRITGTQTTMRMCKSLWGEDHPTIEYGLTCTSGPLGGDAQIAALMCMEDLGALIFFVDPLSAHPHQADIDSLIRLSNCGNVIVCCNPTSAMSMMHTFKCALEKGNRGMIPSFFETLESPAVAEYKRQQELALAAAVQSKPSYCSRLESNVHDEDELDDLIEKSEESPTEVKVGRRLERSRSSLALAGINPDPEKKESGLKKIMRTIKRLPDNI